MIELLREEERIAVQAERAKDRKRLEGFKVGGIINICVGGGMFIFFRSITGAQAPALAGLIPGLIGVGLLVYAIWIAPKPVANQGL